MIASPPPQVSSRPHWTWWAAVGVAAALLFYAPQRLDLAAQYDLTVVFLLSILALSMGFLWGFVGILSLGQTAFYGLGGYAFALWSLNTGDTTLALVLAIVLPALFSAALGYFMFYGRISDIYLSVITLVVTLILEKAIRATSGDAFVIGTVRLNGQNGIPGIPDLQVPWDPSTTLFIDGKYYVAAVFLVLVYVGLRLVLVTRFGRVLVGIRENERRVELLGYDVRRYKLVAFTLCGALAGLAGGLYAVWNNFVAPEMMNLGQAAQVIIWVIVGGRMTLVGPILGTYGVYSLTRWLGTQSVGQVTLVMGAILIVFVLLFRNGLVPAVTGAAHYLIDRIRPRAAGSPAAGSPAAEEKAP